MSEALEGGHDVGASSSSSAWRWTHLLTIQGWSEDRSGMRLRSESDEGSMQSTPQGRSEFTQRAQDDLSVLLSLGGYIKTPQRGLKQHTFIFHRSGSWTFRAKCSGFGFW